MTKAPKLRLSFDAFELDEADARLKRDGTPVPVPPRAFSVLCTLARTPGQLVTKDELLDAVWGHRHVSESVLKTTISELRAALADDAKQPRYIETASRRGYRFIAQAGTMQSIASLAWRKEGQALLDQHSPAGMGAVPNAETSLVEREGAAVPFIGREAALAQLRGAWARAQAGERQLVWITGEAGVGKTSLIETFLSELEPGTAAFGQCVEDFGSGEPYLPILEAVRDLCRRDPELLAAMRAVAPTWLVQMPWLVAPEDRAALYADVGGAHQDRMVREMRELMDRFTAKRPLIFVLEDLHWSDQGTLRMMEHFARRPREVRLLWIASFRLTQVIAEDHPLRALRQELRLHKLCREIPLDPFSESEVAAYLRSRMPQTEIPEIFVRRVHAHTDGLPLFVANVADSVIAQTGGNAWALRELTQSTSGSLPVPDSLAGVIEKQIDRLPEETRGLLEAASVLGMEFRASYLAAMLDRDIDWVCDECDHLVRRQFWVRLAGIDELADGGIDPRYAFQHAIYKHVFYQRASVPQRVQWHRRALKQLESVRAAGTPVPAVELAAQAERGHQFAPALRYYGEAADFAVAHFAPNEALGLTATGLKLLGRVADGPERLELELGLIHRRGVAASQLLGIGSQEAISAFERTLEICEALPPTTLRALLITSLALTRYVCGDYAESERLAQRALAIGGEQDDDVLRVSAALLLGMIHAAKGEHVESVAMLEAGIAACGRMGQVSPGIFVVDPHVALLANIAVPLMAMGRCDDARASIAKAHARAKEVGQPTAQMLAFWVDGMVNVRAEEPMKVIECATVLNRVVAHSMLTQGDGPARWLRGWALAQAGKTREGHKLIREGYEAHAKLGMLAGKTETLGYAAESLVLAQDWQYAQRQIDEALELAHRINEHASTPYLLRLRARVAEGQGNHEPVREMLNEALALARRQKAPYEELKCLYWLVKLKASDRHTKGAMRAVYEQLTQGRDLAFMKKVAAELATDSTAPGRETGKSRARKRR
jgi:DNA-binding winged helix-turn-helix (wHTH) protein/tetratricopeptide (TPR) repeat protein